MVRTASEFWQDLPEGSGKSCQRMLASTGVLETRQKPTRRQRAQFTVAGSDPRSPKGFWRDSNAKNGVAPGHKMFFAASEFGFLSIALGSFSMLWFIRR